MRCKLIILMAIGFLGQSLMATAGEGKTEKGKTTEPSEKPGQYITREQDGPVAAANKKLAAAQRKIKQRAERKALKAESRKLKNL